MESRKYPRTYHLPFSPGVASDDKVAPDWEAILEHPLVLTEKLDGENTCIKLSGAYARSHGAPTRNPWAKNAWEVWDRIHLDIGELEIFGENIYGVHSIEYQRPMFHFYVFGIREGERWMSWEEVQVWAELLELPTVPVRETGVFTPKTLRETIVEHLEMGSALGGECEGFVVRNADTFLEADFNQNILKYVRENHVQTDQHWTRNWTRAMLWHERLAAAR